jgi:U3 small nucleolar RNA-associated protein 13
VGTAVIILAFFRRHTPKSSVHAEFWHVPSGALLVAIDAHEKPVMALDFNPTGTMLVSGSGDNTLKLWAVKV